MLITIPVSAGELIDKITILQIKSERMENPSQKENVARELKELTQVRIQNNLSTSDLDNLAGELKQINEKLWDIEEDIRKQERDGNFGEEFIRLARAVYITNDKRSEVKKQINLLTGSTLIEEKSY